MSENKFTPGKWIYVRNKEQDNPKTGRLILQDKTTNSKNIASIISCIGMSQEEVEANAKLIAAAPELLESIEDLIGILNLISEYLTESGKERVAKALTVIKKATE